ncbi:MAG TPA: hypothetical protein VFN10_04700 [Thermoanaerobaculia bacterium]|nr:hypothetical protein [Thermoanaerobaculia bacterium]
MLHDNNTPHEVWERITDLEHLYHTPAGQEYVVAVEGNERTDGTWAGRVLFTGRGDVRVTAQETSQPSRDALLYWATGLEPVFLDGAFGRATAASMAQRTAPLAVTAELGPG